MYFLICLEETKSCIFPMKEGWYFNSPERSISVRVLKRRRAKRATSLLFYSSFLYHRFYGMCAACTSVSPLFMVFRVVFFLCFDFLNRQRSDHMLPLLQLLFTSKYRIDVMCSANTYLPLYSGYTHIHQEILLYLEHR